jgi:uncharacterized protein (TIGR03437 family)
VALFGANLAPRAQAASSSLWPKVLEQTTVFINGIAMPLGYVSPSQINAQVPSNTKPGQASVTVVSGGRVLAPIELTVGAPVHIK